MEAIVERKRCTNKHRWCSRQCCLQPTRTWSSSTTQRRIRWRWCTQSIWSILSLGFMWRYVCSAQVMLILHWFMQSLMTSKLLLKNSTRLSNLLDPNGPTPETVKLKAKILCGRFRVESKNNKKEYLHLFVTSSMVSSKLSKHSISFRFNESLKYFKGNERNLVYLHVLCCFIVRTNLLLC